MPKYVLFVRLFVRFSKRLTPLLLAGFLASGCSETTPGGNTPTLEPTPTDLGNGDANNNGTANLPNTPPTAILGIASASTGAVPFTATLDASESSDAQDSPEALVARWDFDGDGSWDTAYSTQKIMQHTYVLAGAYTPRVQIRDTGGLTSEATLDREILVTDPNSNPGDTGGDNGGDTGGNNGSSPLADIDSDSNRDGLITDTDDHHEELWSTTSGAVFVSNLDDDDHDGVRDGLDSELNGSDDLAEMTELVIRRMEGLSQNHIVEIGVSPEIARDYIPILSRSSIPASSNWRRYRDPTQLRFSIERYGAST